MDLGECFGCGLIRRPTDAVNLHSSNVLQVHRNHHIVVVGCTRLKTAYAREEVFNAIKQRDPKGEDGVPCPDEEPLVEATLW